MMDPPVHTPVVPAVPRQEEVAAIQTREITVVRDFLRAKGPLEVVLATPTPVAIPHIDKGI